MLIYFNLGKKLASLAVQRNYSNLLQAAGDRIHKLHSTIRRANVPKSHRCSVSYEVFTIILLDVLMNIHFNTISSKFPRSWSKAYVFHAEDVHILKKAHFIRFIF